MWCLLFELVPVGFNFVLDLFWWDDYSHNSTEETVKEEMKFMIRNCFIVIFLAVFKTEDKDYARYESIKFTSYTKYDN